MKYFFIAGEASGDLHGAHLIKAILENDSNAEIQFLGGDMMSSAASVQPVIHYRDMAYMGFAQVIAHLPRIMEIMKAAREKIAEFQPDVVILIDYPSFNLKIAKYAHSLSIPVYYYISPKIWAWKEYRIKDIKRYVNRIYSILPFEVEFYHKHNYEVLYVGNPTVEEIAMREHSEEAFDAFCNHFSLPHKPIISILPGSRRDEIRKNLPMMVDAASRFPEFQCVIAGAPGVDKELYDSVLGERKAPVIFDNTYRMVQQSYAAVVTSGTATLETAILNVPQVVCYRNLSSDLAGRIMYAAFKRILKIKYVSLVNLIADAPVVKELLLHYCNADSIANELNLIINDTRYRSDMLAGYRRVHLALGENRCAQTAALSIVDSLH